MTTAPVNALSTTGLRCTRLWCVSNPSSTDSQTISMPIQSVARIPPSGFFNRFRLPVQESESAMNHATCHLPNRLQYHFCRTITGGFAQVLSKLRAHDDKRGRATGALRDAIGVRVDIERAVGVVMNQTDCDASVAFRELETRSAANSDNILDVVRQKLASIDDGPA
ncbi:ANTAR domain-containing protein [Rhodococcus sp. WS3]|nr:ANTAR domain-containing protein [Rhodococcus sp. WS3]